MHACTCICKPRGIFSVGRLGRISHLHNASFSTIKHHLKAVSAFHRWEYMQPPAGHFDLIDIFQTTSLSHRLHAAQQTLQSFGHQVIKEGRVHQMRALLTRRQCGK